MARWILHRKNRNRLLAVLLGLLLAALTLELGLRLTARLADTSWHHPVDRPSGEEDFLIVCIGDSHTAGVGAPAGLGYPEQLAALLEQRAPGHRFRVVNLGDSGANSAQAVAALTRFYEENDLRPQVVIFQAGKNNDHNFIDAHAGAGGESPDSWRRTLSHSRAFRLMQIARSRIRDLAARGGSGNAYRFFIKSDRERRLLEDWLAADIGLARDKVEEHQGRLLLLNYYLRVQWVDDAYMRAAGDLGLPCVDIRGFGHPMPLPLMIFSPYLGEKSHPNAAGYARIAELVADRLAAEGWLPVQAGDRAF